MTLQRPQSGQRIPNGWFGQLYDEMAANRVRGDGRTIAAVRTPSGTVLSVIRTGKGGGAVNGGMFTLRSIGDGSFEVIDTATGAMAGIAQINGQFYVCPVHQFTPTASVYVCLRYAIPQSGGAGDTVDFIETAELPQPDDDYAYGLIGRVIFSGDQATVSQDHTPGTLTIWWQGPCWTEE